MSNRVESREWYEPTPETMQTRKDGERTGALKSELFGNLSHGANNLSTVPAGTGPAEVTRFEVEA